MPSEYRPICVRSGLWLVPRNVAAVAVVWDYYGLIDGNSGYWVTAYCGTFPVRIQRFADMREATSARDRVCERLGAGRFVQVNEAFCVHPPLLGALMLMLDEHGTFSDDPTTRSGQWWVVARTLHTSELFMQVDDDEADASRSLSRIVEEIGNWRPEVRR